MSAKLHWVVMAIAAALALPALAAQAGAAAGATATATASAASAQTELVALVGPRADQLRAAGVQRILARTGKQKRDIQVMTKYGAVYFGWPKGVSPVTFEMQLGRDDGLVVRASGYTEASRPHYAAAFDAVIPEALRQAAQAKALAERPRT